MQPLPVAKANPRTPPGAARRRRGGAELLTRGTRSKSIPQIPVIAPRGPASVTYLVRGSLGADGSVHAHLPHVGRIAVDFHPSRTTRQRLADRCTGRPRVIERGYFRGAIELQGE